MQHQMSDVSLNPVNNIFILQQDLTYVYVKFVCVSFVHACLLAKRVNMYSAIPTILTTDL